MAYSYDQTLKVTFPVVTGVKRPVSMAAEGGKRTLEGSIVHGFSGVASTAGALTIQIGDGTNATRYGVFVADTLVVDQPITGTLTLTEEGYHMGVSDDLTIPQTYVFTLVGAGASTDIVAVVGYY